MISRHSHCLLFHPRFPGWRNDRNFPGATGSVKLFVACFALFFAAIPARAVILWSDLRAIPAHETGPGKDLLRGAVKRDETSNDTLYFRFHVNPLSDGSTEEYFAALELYEADKERLAVGNASKAWAYSAFFNAGDSSQTKNPGTYIDLHSSHPEPPRGTETFTYQIPERGLEVTIVLKIQFVAEGDDLVTIWLNPDLGPGATEVYQPEALTTRFTANATFDELRLRHGGGGEGWIFSDMAVATAFSDFVDSS